MTTDTYGIEYGDIVAIFALVIAIAAFVIQYFGHKRGERSEQIIMSREIWDRIETQYLIIKVWTLLREPVRQSRESRIDLKRGLIALRNELRYFVYYNIMILILILLTNTKEAYEQIHLAIGV